MSALDDRHFAAGYEAAACDLPFSEYSSDSWKAGYRAFLTDFATSECAKLIEQQPKEMK